MNEEQGSEKHNQLQILGTKGLHQLDKQNYLAGMKIAFGFGTFLPKNCLQPVLDSDRGSVFSHQSNLGKKVQD